MRTLVRIFTVTVLLLCIQEIGMAQSLDDQAKVLQKCVDLQELQQHYPKNLDNSFKPLVVMQHGISFPTDIPVTHNNNPLLFKSKAEISGETAYFLFWKFDVMQNSASIDFTYNYDSLTAAPKAKKVTLLFEKTGIVWNITSTTIEDITL